MEMFGFFPVNCSYLKVDPLQIFQSARIVRTNLALIAKFVHFFPSPYKSVQIWHIAKFVHFYREEEKKCTNLAKCQICAHNSGTLPDL